MSDFRYCTIFCYPSSVLETFRQEFIQAFNLTQVSKSFFASSTYNVSIVSNKEFDQLKSKDFPDGFLYFKVVVEFEFEVSCSSSYCANVIGICLNWLWGRSTPAVASYDLETMLPNQGGYNDENVPWL